ncbi:MAG: hypothetical protein M1544_02540 [Candidatus Marsarchaeota archaeon]|nr:hypothetical protein [Candidatus Marsarchaeota archaeon]
MYEDEREGESGCGCGCRGMGGGMNGRMHGMGFGMMADTSEMGPLHRERLIERLKLYKEDLEEQAKFIEKRIKDIQQASKESGQKEE